jgi:hypothetical protein
VSTVDYYSLFERLDGDDERRLLHAAFGVLSDDLVAPPVTNSVGCLWAHSIPSGLIRHRPSGSAAAR